MMEEGECQENPRLWRKGSERLTNTQSSAGAKFVETWICEAQYAQMSVVACNSRPKIRC